MRAYPGRSGWCSGVSGNGQRLGLRYTPYTLVLVFAAVVAAWLAIHAWRRGVGGAREIAVLSAAVCVWNLGYAAEMASVGLEAKALWAVVEYAGIVTVPVAWFVFSLGYTGRARWVTRRNLALLAVIPLVTVTLMWTNGSHGLIWSRAMMDPTGQFLIVERGPFFWVHVSYSYLLNLLGSVFLVRTLMRSYWLYRRQVVALLVAVMAPWIANGIYLSGLNPWPGLDLTSFAFLVSGGAVAWGLFRYRFLEIVPVARAAVVEGMNDAVIVADPRDRVVDLNPAAGNVLGLSTSEAVGGDLSELAPELGALLDGFGAAEEAQKEVELGEGRRSYEMSLSALKDRMGRPTGRLLVLRDVTERKKVEEELVRQKAQLAHANAELEHFAYLIAHDLRAPLRSIDGFSRILAEDYGDRLDEEGVGYLNRVRGATGKMAQMIEDLLDLAHLTRTTLRRETVDLGALAESAVAELRQGQPGRSLEFVAADGLVVEGDPRLLRVAVGNLLENAWKFTGKNADAKVEFGAERENGTMVYFVRDNGVGFDPAYTEQLFGAFKRLHTSEEFEGTGIGLAAVARVIERHGGRVSADGAVGEGATFYFTL